QPGAALARTNARDGEHGVLYDAHWNPDFGRTLVQAMQRRRRFGGDGAELGAAGYPALSAALAGTDLSDLYVHVPRAEQSNTSILIGDRLIVKTFRRLEP